MKYLLLVIGFIILIYSGKYLVKGSIAIAYRFKVSKLVIGLTVVAFGTSAPELFVSVMAAINNHPGISVGNVVGSNIINIGLVLAITAMIFPIPVRKSSIKYDWPVMMLASILFYVFILDGYLQFLEGLFFILLLSAYIIFSICYSRKNYNHHEIPEEVHFSTLVSILAIILSSAGLAFGSDLLVKNATKIAENFHIDDRIISITLIAFGTSVPELVTSAAAAFKKEMDISIGNIIGSNIFNILCVLGVTSMIKKIEIPAMTMHFDVFWMLGLALLLFLFILPLKGGRLTQPKGLVLFMVYCVYVYLLFVKM
jgi:cation:H+ antiporter